MTAQSSPSPASSKPRKIGKLLRYLIFTPLSILLLFLLLLTVSIFFLSATQSGTSLLLNRVSNTFSDLELEGVDGSLLGDLKIQRVFWEKDGLEIEIADAELKSLGLLPDVSVGSLTADRITVFLPTDKEEKKRKPFEITLPDLHLPIDVDLQNVAVDELHIKQGDALVKLRDVQLSAQVVKDTLKLRNLSGDLYDDDGELIVKANGDMGLSSPHSINLSVVAKSDSKRIGVGLLDLGIKGEVADYHLTAKGHWKYAEYPEYQLNLLGKGNLE
ncbi:MAG: hypothetical protein V3U78_10765, partial [Thiotrichaceae bacterium]